MTMSRAISQTRVAARGSTLFFRRDEIGMIKLRSPLRRGEF